MTKGFLRHVWNIILVTVFGLTLILGSGVAYAENHFPHYRNGDWVTEGIWYYLTNSGTSDINIAFSYDESGNATTAEVTDISGFIGGDYSIIYYYNSNGMKTKQETHYDDDGISDRTIYFYYGHSGIWNKVEYDNDNNGTIEAIYTAIYDENGNITKVENDTDGDGSTDSVTLYLYDNDGKLIKTQNDYTYDTYTYDSNGNCTKMETFREDGTVTMTKTYLWKKLPLSANPITPVADDNGGGGGCFIMHFEKLKNNFNSVTMQTFQLRYPTLFFPSTNSFNICDLKIIYTRIRTLINLGINR